MSLSGDHPNASCSTRESVVESARRAGRIFAFEDERDLPILAREFSPADALELQLHLLPTRPPKIEGFRLDAVSFPAALVGGDHFNFMAVGGERVGLLLFDVSGKGAPAAIVAARLRAIFRTQTWGNRDVRDVLGRAHEFLLRVLPPASFVTAVYAILDPEKQTLTWARAGHEPLMRITPGKDANIIQLGTASGLPLGIGTREEFLDLLEPQTWHLEHGERVLLFTDGLTEAQDALRNEFGIDRILGTLRDSKDDDISALQSAVTQFVGNAPPHDDLTMLSLAVE